MASFPFDYELPPGRIAEEPCEPRDQARLLVLGREKGTLDHRHFHDLPDLLQPGDLLILNDTRVLPARLYGQRQRTAGKWEGLFVREHPHGLWELMGQTRGTLVAGETIAVEPGPLTLTLIEKLPEGRWLMRPDPAGPVAEMLQRSGRMPLPPYLRKGVARSADEDRYQTVYAREAGAIAAPTAGLHFTPRLFERLEERGIGRAFVTLHVGLGTFQPIQTDDYTQHPMHREWGTLPAATVQAIEACKANGGRVVAVGTTSVRVLETAAQHQPLRAWSGESSLFIYPPYSFRVVDALVTNFHLPRTTLLLLVAAFAGIERTEHAYRVAIETGYRFYSYGDAMLIV